jgi:hypothetical protein
MLTFLELGKQRFRDDVGEQPAQQIALSLVTQLSNVSNNGSILRTKCDDVAVFSRPIQLIQRG